MRPQYLLLRCRVDDPAGLSPGLQAWCAGSGLPLQPWRAAWLPGDGQSYAYARVLQAAEVTDTARVRLEQAWRQLLPQAQAVDLSRLTLILDRAGRTPDAVPRTHYVVETDPEDGWADEIDRWYAQGHLPGLAAVEGCIHAMRLHNHDSGPVSLACYDLTDGAVTESPAWLAVRASAWSDIARPHFTNTRRTVMQVV